MKKFTLFMAAAITALSMTAATPGQKKMHERPAGNALKTFEMPCKNLKKASADKMALKVKANGNDEIIWDKPEGELKYFVQYGMGYELWDMAYLFQYDSDCAGQIVFGNNNEVYIKNAISSFKGTGWVKGELSKAGKKITVKYPQYVLDVEGYNEEEELITAKVYVSIMKYNNEQGYDDYLPVSDEENVVTYTINADGTITMDGSKDAFDKGIDPDTGEEVDVLPEKMLTTYYTYYDKKTSKDLTIWFGYGDIAQKFTPLPDDLIYNEYPEEINFERWAMFDSTGKAQSIEVAIQDDYVYVKNFHYYIADCIVKGKIEGDKVTFPSKQFFGLDLYEYDFIFFFGCTYGEYWDEEYQDYYEGYILADKLVMNLDRENMILYAPEKTGYVMNASPYKVWYYCEALEPIFRAQDPADLNCAPQDPEFVEYFYVDDYEQHWFCWMLPNTTVEGAFVDTNMMYYNMYINGEIYTLSPDVYPYVSEEITDIPYAYSDDNNYDIVLDPSDPVGRQYYIYYDDMKKFGIVMYYMAPDGNLYNSMRVTYNLLDETVEKDDAAIDTPSYAEPTSIEFYNLQGMKVANPTAGNIYIRSITFKDGSRQATKFIAR